MIIVYTVFSLLSMIKANIRWNFAFTHKSTVIVMWCRRQLCSDDFSERKNQPRFSSAAFLCLLRRKLWPPRWNWINRDKRVKPLVIRRFYGIIWATALPSRPNSQALFWKPDARQTEWIENRFLLVEHNKFMWRIITTDSESATLWFT